jgi:hypothetical protein
VMAGSPSCAAPAATHALTSAPAATSKSTICSACRHEQQAAGSRQQAAGRASKNVPRDANLASRFEFVGHTTVCLNTGDMRREMSGASTDLTLSPKTRGCPSRRQQAPHQQISGWEMLSQQCSAVASAVAPRHSPPHPHSGWPSAGASSQSHATQPPAQHRQPAAAAGRDSSCTISAGRQWQQEQARTKAAQ